MKTYLVVAGVMALAIPAAGTAQTVGIGDRVRIHRTDDVRVIARLVDVGPTGLRLRTDDGDVYVTPARVRTIERSMGRQRRVGRNLLITTALGAVTVGTIALVGDDGTCTEGMGGCAGAGGAFVLGAIAGAIVSAPIGLIVGLMVRSEQWEPATLAPPLGASLTFTPTDAGRVRVGVRLPVGPRR